MKSYADNKANGAVQVEPEPNAALANTADYAVNLAIRKQVALSVAAHNRIIADAADAAVRIALRSFGIFA